MKEEKPDNEKMKEIQDTKLDKKKLIQIDR